MWHWSPELHGRPHQQRIGEEAIRCYSGNEKPYCVLIGHHLSLQPSNINMILCFAPHVTDHMSLLLLI